MLTIRWTVAGVVAATMALGAGAQAASAATVSPTAFAIPTFASYALPAQLGGVSATSGVNNSTAAPCGLATGPHGQGATAGTTAQVCTGSGLTYIGPAIGEIASVIGPTIIGPAVVTNVNVSAGNGNAG